jgi:hypothetical protein
MPFAALPHSSLNNNSIVTSKSSKADFALDACNKLNKLINIVNHYCGHFFQSIDVYLPNVDVSRFQQKSHPTHKEELLVFNKSLHHPVMYLHHICQQGLHSNLWDEVTFMKKIEKAMTQVSLWFKTLSARIQFDFNLFVQHFLQKYWDEVTISTIEINADGLLHIKDGEDIREYLSRTFNILKLAGIAPTKQVSKLMTTLPQKYLQAFQMARALNPRMTFSDFLMSDLLDTVSKQQEVLPTASTTPAKSKNSGYGQRFSKPVTRFECSFHGLNGTHNTDQCRRNINTASPQETNSNALNTSSTTPANNQNAKSSTSHPSPNAKTTAPPKQVARQGFIQSIPTAMLPPETPISTTPRSTVGSVYVRTPVSRPTIIGKMFQNSATFILDTGAEVSVIPKSLVPKQLHGMITTSAIHAAFLDGTSMSVEGDLMIQFQLLDETTKHPQMIHFEHLFLVVNIPANMGIILGNDWMLRQSVILNQQNFSFKVGNCTFKLQVPPSLSHVHAAALQSEVSLEPGMAQDVPIRSFALEIPEGHTSLFEPVGNDVVSGLYFPAVTLNNSKPYIVARNFSSRRVVLPKGTLVGLISIARVFDPKIVGLVSSSDISELEQSPASATEDDISSRSLPSGVDISHLKSNDYWFQSMSRLLKFNDDIFYKGIPSRSNLGKFRFLMKPDAKGFTTKLRRFPLKVATDINDAVELLLQQNHVHATTHSDYISQVVPVYKPDGSLRLCVDYRLLNEKTVKEQYPLPRIEDLLDQLHGVKFMSKTDNVSAFNQFEIEPEDQHYTAFQTPHGIFEWENLCFGVINAPAFYQRMMDKMLVGITNKFLLCYMDDTLTFTKTSWEDHLDHLQQFFNRLRKANVLLKGSKCQFGVTSIDFLGQIVSNQGIRPDPKKITKIQNAPQPKTISELRTFLGMVNYYRKFIPNMSDICEPLNQLLRGSATKLSWTSQASASFQKCKYVLSSSPILKSPDPTKAFTIYTDASNTGIGAVLTQNFDGLDHPIYYSSRSLNKAERNYTVTERELLAVVWALKNFYTYVGGTSFTVYTDHAALQYLDTIRKTQYLNGRLQRWIQFIDQFQVTLKYIKGDDNSVADYLSRYPDVLPEDAPIVGFIDAVDSMVLTEIKQLQQVDETLTVPRDKALKNIDGYFYNDGILYRQTTVKKVARDLLVIPQPLRHDILRVFHDDKLLGAHTGIQTTKHKILQRYFWPTLRKDVKDYRQSCKICRDRYPNYATQVKGLQPMPMVCPFHTMAVDVLGPITTSRSGNRFIVVFTDTLTKWTEAFAVPEHTAETIAELFVQEIVCRWGSPERLLSDNGPEFASHILKHVTKLLATEKVFTTTYQPSTNGQVERFNRTLADFLASYTNGDDWDEFLPFVMFQYRMAFHSSTGFSPFMMMFGREPRLPIDSLLEETNIEYPDEDTYVTQLREKLKETTERAKQYIDRAQAHQKKYYDMKHRNAPIFQENDQVMKFVPVGGKLDSCWNGPYTIHKRTGEHTYLLRTQGSEPVYFVANARHLKNYYTSSIPTDPSNVYLFSKNLTTTQTLEEFVPSVPKNDPRFFSDAIIDIDLHADVDTDSTLTNNIVIPEKITTKRPKPKSNTFRPAIARALKTPINPDTSITDEDWKDPSYYSEPTHSLPTRSKKKYSDDLLQEFTPMNLPTNVIPVAILKNKLPPRGSFLSTLYEVQWSDSSVPNSWHSKQQLFNNFKGTSNLLRELNGTNGEKRNSKRT